VAGSGLQDEVTALTSAALTASRALLAISARSLASAEERVTLPQFCLLVLLAVAAAGPRDQGRLRSRWRPRRAWPSG
jgi:hypothetical protein